MIWRDASGWNYGKFDDPDHPKYNFAREVDYCSGACLMIRRSVFEALGGFDVEFKPAYYEDTDLAFKIRHAGQKVVYQPLARIVHHEGLTSGRSVKSGVKSYQLVNQAKFRNRWSERLAAHPDSPSGPVRLVHPFGLKRTVGGQVLVIDHRLPTPDRDSGSVRMIEIVRAIRRRGHHVAFLPDDLMASTRYQQVLQGIGVEVVHHPYYRSVRSYLKQHGADFDLVIISRAEVALRHMDSVRRFAPRAKVVFDTVDLHFLREQREAQLKQGRKQRVSAIARKQQELELARTADMTLVVSSIEMDLLHKECPDVDVRLLSNILPIEQGDDSGLRGPAEHRFHRGIRASAKCGCRTPFRQGCISPGQSTYSRVCIPGDWLRASSGNCRTRKTSDPGAWIRARRSALL